jgi:hypothetical protein
VGLCQLTRLALTVNARTLIVVPKGCALRVLKMKMNDLLQRSLRSMSASSR